MIGAGGTEDAYVAMAVHCEAAECLEHPFGREQWEVFADLDEREIIAQGGVCCVSVMHHQLLP
jgi:hypothetical protein